MPSGVNLRGSAADETNAERSATQRVHREVGESICGYQIYINEQSTKERVSSLRMFADGFETSE